MVAIKYREGLNFLYPEKIRQSNILPEGFDELISEIDYNNLILNNASLYETYKQNLTAVSGAGKFRIIRDKWQEIADKFAYENTQLGITAIQGKTKEVADAFSKVVYYLSVNAPTEALNEIDNITRGEVFLTEERLSAIKAEFGLFLASL